VFESTFGALSERSTSFAFLKSLTTMSLAHEGDDVDRCDAQSLPSDFGTGVLHKYPALEWLIPALFCAVLLAELFLTGDRLSQTADEATHLYAGYRYLKCGDLTVSSEHPPLARIVAAAPLLPMNIAVDCRPSKEDGLYQALAAQNWLYAQNWPVVLARARTAAYLFAVGMCVALWIAARRMFGFGTAIVAALLLIFEPNVLAYGSLVLTDVPVTCMLLCAVLTFYFWTVRRKAIFCLLTILANDLAGEAIGAGRPANSCSAGSCRCPHAEASSKMDAGDS
jgi:Dolichyl-phosphate-mannose-protein mannosyltransferase